jgi:hypothetical protein
MKKFIWRHWRNLNLTDCPIVSCGRSLFMGLCTNCQIVYFLKFMQVLQIIGFVGRNADPCMMVSCNNNGFCFIAIWVDDSLLIGHDAAIEQTIHDLKAHGFGLKIEGESDDYLSCKMDPSASLDQED